ncbi:MAG: hypothetical protein HKN20_11590 [Gemmatimonadetes bacterium]|nr:hypothetical protein [Gemmatimonadota bacterium]
MTRTFVSFRFFSFASITLFVLLAHSPPALATQFESIGTQAGLEVTGELSEFGHGVCIFDFEGDGDLDVYVTNGVGSPNQLFLNDGGFTFTEAVNANGAADSGHAKACIAADYDNDGDPDLYVTHYGEPNRLYRNDAGTFVDIASVANVGGGNLYSTGAAWGDVNADGRLDLYVTNRGITLAGEPNLLYRNDGNDTFAEVAAASGVEGHSMTFQPLFTDYDLDGDSDLYISSDKFLGNQLFRNDGAGDFVDVSVATGSDLAMDGMGVASGDVNADGRSDIFVTNTPAGHRCLVSQPDATFLEMADTLGITVGEIGWGAVFFDCDLDGDEDLFQVNEVPNRLFRNDGVSPWADITPTAGVGGGAISMGCATGDLDGDGDLDLYVSNVLNVCEVYRNETPAGSHWLRVDTEGTVSNRDGIGARVEIEIAGQTQFREIQAGTSYLSQNDHRAHFGLGGATLVDRVEVRWPSGIVDVMTNVAADQSLTVVEGATATTVRPPAGGPGTVMQLFAYPNPLRHAITVETNLERASRVSLRVVNLAGREVYREELGYQGAGALFASWDGLDPRGDRLPPGVYWLSLGIQDDRGTRQNVVQKITLVR